MKYEWKDLPERENYFTVKNTAMVNLNTGKSVRQYCTNTKIAVVQKCVTPDKTYYRTYEAAHHNLNYAFEAEAFGLPNEKAPLAPSDSISLITHTKPVTRPTKPAIKHTAVQNASLPKNGGGGRLKKWIRKILRRKDG